MKKLITHHLEEEAAAVCAERVRVKPGWWVCEVWVKWSSRIASPTASVMERWGLPYGMAGEASWSRTEEQGRRLVEEPTGERMEEGGVFVKERGNEFVR